jgi:hypothetical protein
MFLSRLAALAATLAAVVIAAPFALGATPISPANGKEFLVPNGTLFELDAQGVYHRVPDLPTATEMGVLWSSVKKASTVSPIGRSLPSVLTLPSTQVKTAPPSTMANGADFLLPGGSVYQRDATGVYHLVPDILTANAMHIDWRALARVSDVKPIGAPLRSVVVSVKKVCAKTTAAPAKAGGNEVILPNGNVYEVSGGTYHLIPDIATAGAMGLNWATLHRVGSISSAGAPIPSVCVA